MSQSIQINRSAADAWSQLVKSGALDIDGRDKEFAGAVCKMLDPTGTDLGDALAKATTDQLIQVFFRALQPFSEMYREILRFFTTAGAKYGREQWRIGISEKHFELSDFEDFVRMWDGVPGEIDVPALGHEDFGVVWLAWEAYPQLGNLANKAAREQELGDGRLLDLFPDHDVATSDFDTAAWLLYPSRAQLPAKSRVFIDFLRMQVAYRYTAK